MLFSPNTKKSTGERERIPIMKTLTWKGRENRQQSWIQKYYGIQLTKGDLPVRQVASGILEEHRCDMEFYFLPFFMRGINNGGPEI